jgi:hypothetical protein
MKGGLSASLASLLALGQWVSFRVDDNSPKIARLLGTMNGEKQAIRKLTLPANPRVSCGKSVIADAVLIAFCRSCYLSVTRASSPNTGQHHRS